MIDTLITAARQATRAQLHLIPALNISECFSDTNARLFFRRLSDRFRFCLNLHFVRRLGEHLDSPEFPSFEYWFIKLPPDTPWDRETRSFQIDSPEECFLAISNAMESLSNSAATLLSDKTFLSPFSSTGLTPSWNPLRSLHLARECLLDLQNCCKSSLQNCAADEHIWHYVDHILIKTNPLANIIPEPPTSSLAP